MRKLTVIILIAILGTVPALAGVRSFPCKVEASASMHPSADCCCQRSEASVSENLNEPLCRCPEDPFAGTVVYITRGTFNINIQASSAAIVLSADFPASIRTLGPSRGENVFHRDKILRAPLFLLNAAFLI